VSAVLGVLVRRRQCVGSHEVRSSPEWRLDVSTIEVHGLAKGFGAAWTLEAPSLLLGPNDV